VDGEQHRAPEHAAQSRQHGGEPLAPDWHARWEHAARTRAGVEYRIRPIRADDTDRDRDFIAGLSAVSRYRRMMGSMRTASSSLIDHLVHVDYRRSMAFVAVAGDAQQERIIGVARYGAEPEGTEAEFAVAVSDPWQSQGVGTALLLDLADYAVEHGLSCLRGIILASNDPMLKLAHRLGMTTRRDLEDSALLEASWELSHCHDPRVGPHQDSERT
jgi:acetyltransferase